MSISLDLSNIDIEIDENIRKKATDSLKKLLNKTGEGNNCLGWINYPVNYDNEDCNRVIECSKRVQKNSEILVVVGVGGSYLGSRAVENALKPYFGNNDGVKLIYAGHQLSASYIVDLLKYLEDKDYSINVVSKSGATMETMIAFRILQESIEKKYGKKEARERIYVTTNKSKGKLLEIAKKEKYETFFIPDNIGGRFSSLTVVGFFPLAVSGIDVKKLMYGANKEMKRSRSFDIEDNLALKYAIVRNVLYNQGKKMEILGVYEEKLKYFTEWWKQLTGESEGKDNKGVFPVTSMYTTDLHSMGQIIQDGPKNIFETVISIKNPEKDILIDGDCKYTNLISHLSGCSVDYINKKVMEGTAAAHTEGKVPNILIEIEKLDEENIGQLIYFFQMAIAISGYILGVNPFNQPGVEKYKDKVIELF